MNKVPPRPFMVHALVVSLLLTVIIGAELINLYGTIIVIGLSCVFGYVLLYKLMDRFYGWYLKEKAAGTNGAGSEAGGAAGTVVVDIPTCPNCGDIFKSRSFHEPKAKDGWSLCDCLTCPFGIRPLVPRE